MINISKCSEVTETVKGRFGLFLLLLLLVLCSGTWAVMRTLYLLLDNEFMKSSFY
jgi:hypothetical protein